MRNHTAKFLITGLSLACAAMIACDGSDAPGDGDAPGSPDAARLPDAAPSPDAALLPDAAPPEPLPALRLVFPPRDAMTSSSTVRVRGVAPDDGSIASVAINGAPVTTSDGYATWEHTLALTPGANAISVTAVATDGSMLEGVSQTVVYSPTSLTAPVDLAMDVASDVAHVIESDDAVIVAVELATGAHQVASSSGVGIGPLWSQPLRIERAGAMLHVLARTPDGSAPVLLAIDPQTGDRIAVADATTGSGPMVTDPVDLVIDPAAQRALITDRGQPGVLAIDLVTGTRSWLSEASTGVGPALVSPGAAALDVSNGRALVVDDGRLLAIDLVTGDRALVVDGFLAREIALDATPGSLLSLRATRLNRTDLATGQTVTLSSGWIDIDHKIALGPPLASASAGLAVDASNNRVVVVDPGLRLPLAVDLTSGNRVTPWGFRALDPGTAVAANSAIYISDRDYGSVWKLGLYGRDTALVSGFGRGAGEELRNAIALSIDPAQDRLIYADHIAYDVGADRSLIGAIDVQTGNRTVISASNLGPSVGSGTAFNWIRGMAVDFAANRALVAVSRDLGTSGSEPCARSALLSTDLTSGVREVFSGKEFSEDPADPCAPDAGTGPLGQFLSPANVAGAPSMLATDGSSLLGVDRTTGDRALISGPTRGQGPAVDGLYARLSFHDGTRRALVVSWPTSAVFSIDIDTGDREVFADLTAHGQPSNPNTRFAVMDRAGETVFVGPLGEGLLSGLWMIDRVTGERVLAW